MAGSCWQLKRSMTLIATYMQVDPPASLAFLHPTKCGTIVGHMCNLRVLCTHSDA